MHALKAIRKIVDQALNWTTILMFTIIFLVVLAQIFWRYFLRSPLVWSEELSLFIFIWVSMIGWALATRSGTHIRITFIEDMLPSPARRAVKFLFRLVTIGFLAILIWLGYIMAERTFGRGAVTIPQIPIGMFYAALPVSAVLCMFYVVYDLVAPAEAADAPAVME